MQINFQYYYVLTEDEYDDAYADCWGGCKAAVLLTV